MRGPEERRATDEVAPEISIVVPVWGAHVAYVEQATDSVRTQEGPTVEVVVVDNASDDPVGDLGGQVRVVRTPRRLAVGAARNFGLEQARGRYVLFWDADDIMLPGALRRMWETIDADPEIVCVTMDSVRWTPETGPGEPWPWPRAPMYRLATRPRLFALIALLHNPFTTTGPALMRTSAVRSAGGFPEDIAFFEDWALSASLTVRGRVVMLREVARWYRVHDDSLSLGHLDNPEQVAWLRGIRRRTRADPMVPAWLKALLPIVHVGHLLRARRGRKPGVGGGYYEAALEGVNSSARRP